MSGLELAGHREKTWVVIPVKGFSRGKSRLSAVLPPSRRAAFARALFEHVFGVVRASEKLGGVLVATDDDAVVELALAQGAHALLDAELVPPAQHRPLCQVVDAALAHLAGIGAGAALVVMSDLPHLRSGELLEILEILDRCDVVIAPDERELGTNILGLRSPGGFATCFGHPDSFRRHLAAASTRGLRLEVHKSPGIGFDVDSPEDLLRISDHSVGTSDMSSFMSWR